MLQGTVLYSTGYSTVQYSVQFGKDNGTAATFAHDIVMCLICNRQIRKTFSGHCRVLAELVQEEWVSETCGVRRCRQPMAADHRPSPTDMARRTLQPARPMATPIRPWGRPMGSDLRLAIESPRYCVYKRIKTWNRPWQIHREKKVFSSVLSSTNFLLSYERNQTNTCGFRMFVWKRVKYYWTYGTFFKDWPLRSTWLILGSETKSSRIRIQGIQKKTHRIRSRKTACTYCIKNYITIIIINSTVKYRYLYCTVISIVT
jgi:hypothetical protein